MNKKLEKIYETFKNDSDLNSLESCSLFSIQIKQQIDASKHKILFLDMPLLIEIYDDIVGEGICIDEVWLVYCDREAQIKRLMKRDGISYEKATLKVNAQMDIEEKRKFSDRVIENTKDKAYLIENIDIALNQKFYQ